MKCHTFGHSGLKAGIARSNCLGNSWFFKDQSFLGGPVPLYSCGLNRHERSTPEFSGDVMCDAVPDATAIHGDVFLVLSRPRDDDHGVHLVRVDTEWQLTRATQGLRQEPRPWDLRGTSISARCRDWTNGLVVLHRDLLVIVQPRFRSSGRTGFFEPIVLHASCEPDKPEPATFAFGDGTRYRALIAGRQTKTVVLG
ncbi:MAG: hypothetical protein U0136_06475 [Bdellovibrionota bacterium]